MAIDNKRIAKNTAFMYFRMLLTMFIGLFSVRIVLKALGIEGYGVYNVVGGIVTMLAFLNNALSSTTQRFLSFELGKENKVDLRSIFCNSMTLYLWLCVVLLFFAETVGLWFVNYKLVIPEAQMAAANWIYQFSIISFLCSILSSPYNAAIIAHEKMDVYAYVSVAEAILKLVMIFSLLVLSGDKLILYGLFMMLISVVIFLYYMQYCLKRFEETKYRYDFSRKQIKEIGSFAGWGVWGALSNIFKGQGVNILLNLFFGPVVNASRAIAYQVEGAVNTLVQNFYTAMRPQMIKSYASNDRAAMFKLLYMSSRLGYYLMFLVSVIFIFETPIIFSIWLGQEAQYAVGFTRLILISQLFIVLANPLMTAVHATGKVAIYQFWSGWIFIFVLPVSYLLLKFVADCYLPFYVLILSSVAYFVLTIERCFKLLDLPLKTYCVMAFKLLLVSIIIVVGAICIHSVFDYGWLRFVILCVYTLVIGAVAILFLDCSKAERQFLFSFVRNKLTEK